MSANDKWLILLSLATVFIFMAIIGYVAEFGGETNNAINLKLVRTRFILAALLIACGYFIVNLSPIPFILILTCTTVIQYIIAGYYWITGWENVEE